MDLHCLLRQGMFSKRKVRKSILLPVNVSEIL